MQLGALISDVIYRRIFVFILFVQPLISQTTTCKHLSHTQQLTTTYLTNNNLQPLISQTTTYSHLSHKQNEYKNTTIDDGFFEI
jgi:hypothetical protein